MPGPPCKLGSMYMTTKEAARQLNVHPRTVIRAAKRGNLHGIKIGRSWRILLPALERA